MQTIGDQIRLRPAWPKGWDADFMLHGPRPTTVTGRVRDGKLIDVDLRPNLAAGTSSSSGRRWVPQKC